MLCVYMFMCMYAFNVCGCVQVKERPDVGVYVKDLSSFVVKSPDQMDKLMTVGAKNSE